MTTFGASVQYNDWKGTAAADSADMNDISKLLKKRGELSDGEFLVGLELWLGEMHGDEIKPPFVKAYVSDGQNYEAVERKLSETSDPLTMKQVELDDLSMDEFLLLFKRFAISLSWKGLDLTGREISARPTRGRD